MFGGKNNVIVVLGIVFAFILLASFLGALFESNSGEVAVAIGGFIGGVIAAGGAIWAVYLTFARQRDDETVKVRDAVRTEVTAFAKYVIGAIDLCKQIKAGTVQIPQQDARYVLKSLWADPIIYPAVADRIGLLPHPHATTEFYMRVGEAKAMVEAFRTKTNPQLGLIPADAREFVTPAFASKIADSLITALQLARPIVADDGDASIKARLATLVQATVAGQIDECLQTAQTAFPDAESFQIPVG